MLPAAGWSPLDADAAADPRRRVSSSSTSASCRLGGGVSPDDSMRSSGGGIARMSMSDDGVCPVAQSATSRRES